jgi:hypothetical protein
MTETHPNLVTWFDGELSANEAAAVARHVESCAACSRQYGVIRGASGDLQLYCDATFTAAFARRKVFRWVPVLATLAAFAAVAILALPRKRSVVPPPIPSPVATVAPAPTQPLGAQPPVAHKLAHRHRTVPATPRTVTSWPATDSAVEIAIPADAVFAPGALPEGTRLYAEMRIGPDGSLREIRLRQ